MKRYIRSLYCATEIWFVYPTYFMVVNTRKLGCAICKLSGHGPNTGAYIYISRLSPEECGKYETNSVANKSMKCPILFHLDILLYLGIEHSVHMILNMMSYKCVS